MASESPTEKLNEYRYRLLLMSIAVLQLAPVISDTPQDARGYGLLWGIVLIAAVYAAAGNRRVTSTMAALAIVGFSARVYTLFVPHGADEALRQHYLELSQLGITALFLAVVIFMMLKDIARDPRIDADSVAGAVCVYLLVGLMWAMFYGMVEFVEPGSFRAPRPTSRTPTVSCSPSFRLPTTAT